MFCKIVLDKPPRPAPSPYQGWTNSATFLFNTLFLQEPSNYEKVIKILHKPEAILLVMQDAQRTGKMRQVEKWAAEEDNVVYAIEIIENLRDGLRPTAEDAP